MNELHSIIAYHVPFVPEDDDLDIFPFEGCEQIGVYHDPFAERIDYAWIRAMVYLGATHILIFKGKTGEIIYATEHNT